MSLRPVYTRLLKKSVRALGAGALIVLFGLLAWKAGKEALSRGYLESAYFELERSAAPGPLAQQEQWLRAMQYLTDSLRYAPDNAWTLEEMGAHNLRRQRGRSDGKLPMAGISGANVNFHMALLQRPTSPVAWANLALTKHYLGEIDAQLFEALRRADELGPWEFEVQQMVLFISLANWGKLDAAQRTAAVRTLERAMQKNAEKVAKLMQSFNRLDLLCGIKSDKPKLQELCSRPRKSTAEPNSRAR